MKKILENLGKVCVLFAVASVLPGCGEKVEEPTIVEEKTKDAPAKKEDGVPVFLVDESVSQKAREARQVGEADFEPEPEPESKAKF